MFSNHSTNELIFALIISFYSADAFNLEMSKYVSGKGLIDDIGLYKQLTIHKLLVIVSGYIAYGLPVGYYYGLGALFPVILDTFDASRAETSIIQSVFAGFMLGGGILYGAITSRFGPKKATVSGSLVTSLSLIISFWATNFPFLVAINVVTAIGCGMGFVSSTVGVRQQFSGKAVVVVLAIVSSASGTVGVGFTYVFRILSEAYGLRGTLLIIGGFQLNVAVVCLLWRNPGTGSRFRNTPTIDDNTSNSYHDIKLEANNGNTSEFHTKCTDAKLSDAEANVLYGKLSDVGLNNLKSCIEDTREADKAGNVEVLVEHGNRMSPRPGRHLTIRNEKDNELNKQSNGHMNKAYERESSISEEALEDLRNIEHSDMVHVEGQSVSYARKLCVKNAQKSCEETSHSRLNESSDIAKISIKAKLHHILKLPSYIFTVIGILFCINALQIYIVFILDMYVDKGFSEEDGSNGLALMNIVAILGRASPALLAKCSCYNTFFLPIVSSMLASVAMMLCSVVQILSVLLVLFSVIGFTLGVMVSVIVVNISELVSTQYLAEAVGLLMSINGVFVLSIGPLTGYIRDSTGSYSSLQILSGAFCGIGSFMFMVAAFFKGRQTRKKVSGTRKKHSIFYVTKL